MDQQLNWRNKPRLWQQCYLEGNTTADTVSSTCTSYSSVLLFPQHAFEQPSPLTALFLQVTATDHLPPHGKVNSTINIVLLDENDNSPTFRDTPYRQEIFCNMTAGMAILQVLEILSTNDIFELNSCMSPCLNLKQFCWVGNLSGRALGSETIHLSFQSYWYYIITVSWIL